MQLYYFTRQVIQAIQDSRHWEGTWMMWQPSYRQLHAQPGSSSVLTSWYNGLGWRLSPRNLGAFRSGKGLRDDRTVFTAGGEKVPLLKEQPVRSLGREYTPELSDRQMGKLVQKQLREGLEKNRQQPASWETEGMVLPVHTFPAGDVAPEGVRNTIIPG